MRVIKFKAKDINGGWVYGSFLSSESTIVCMGCDLLPMCSHKICDAIDSEIYTQFKKVRT